MSGLEIQWPDEGAERVRAARGRLAVAGEALRARSFDDRLAAVTRVLSDWTAPDSPWRRELVPALASVTPFAEGTIAEGLESALRAWRPEDFVTCARREVGIDARGTAPALVPFDCTTVIAGGTIPMPTILSALLPLVLGSPVLLRETAKDPVTPNLVARSLTERDAGLGASFEPVAFPSTDDAAYAEALASPCVVATGADPTLADLAGRLTSSQRFVGYGHRFSIAVVGPHLRGPDAIASVAEGLARDVARWDQTGCLSPVVTYLLDVDRNAAKELATAISEALTRIGANMPCGPLAEEQSASIAYERSEARMRAAAGGAMSFEEDTHTVVLESDARARPAPLGRFLRLMPVDSQADLERTLAPFSGHLSNVAVAGTSRDAPLDDDAQPTRSLSRSLSRLGVSRITTPGRLQTPPVDWPHDGLPLFTPLARFSLSD